MIEDKTEERIMSKKQKFVLWPTLLIVAVGVSALGFVRSHRRPGIRATEKQPANAQKASASPSTNSENQVRRGFLNPQLIPNLIAFGDRLEKQGKERLTITGTLNSSGGQSSITSTRTLYYLTAFAIGLVVAAQT